MQNIRTPKKHQGQTPARGKKRRRLQFGATDETEDYDSSASTTILTSSPSTISGTRSTPERREVHSPVASTPVKQTDGMLGFHNQLRASLPYMVL